jgi:hypothetical protein
MERTPRPPRELGPDGVERTARLEHEINDLFAAAFAGGAGKEALKHLRSITIETIAGPHVSSDELRHREGMRFLVAVIEERVKRGSRK